MLLNDRQIRNFAQHGMIEPFVDGQVRLDGDRPVISYGLSSFGYDIRLSPDSFFVFRRVLNRVVDPKNFDRRHLEAAPLQSDSSGSYFIVPANSYALGVSIERFAMPRNITATALGKSTYARCGLSPTITPLECGWEGHLTIELSNASDADCRVYANEGIAQLQFWLGEMPEVSYADRSGKYQNQAAVVVTARV